MYMYEQQFCSLKQNLVTLDKLFALCKEDVQF